MIYGNMEVMSFMVGKMMILFTEILGQIFFMEISDDVFMEKSARYYLR